MEVFFVASGNADGTNPLPHKTVTRRSCGMRKWFGPIPNLLSCPPSKHGLYVNKQYIVLEDCRKNAKLN